MSRALQIRAVALFVFAVFVFGGPFVEQVLRYKMGPIQSWQMYSGYGVGQCVGGFYGEANGTFDRIDHLRVVRGVDDWREQSWGTRRIREQDLDWWARRLCDRGRFTDVRADLKCATRRGWRTVRTRDKNLCRRKK